MDLDLNPDSESDPELTTDPNLQIISDPAGSGCTTLTAMHEEETVVLTLCIEALVGRHICLYHVEKMLMASRRN